MAAALLALSSGILNIHIDTASPLQDLAIDKLSQFIHVMLVLVGLTLLAKEEWKSIYLSRGKLVPGIVFGLVSFAVFAVIAVVTQAGSGDLVSSLFTSVPWLLLFIFANSIMEELWFRAIFLRKYERLIGGNAVIIVTAAVFGASHLFATYDFPGGGIVFGVVVFCLGIVGANTMIKYDSLVGPVLFHAAYDLVVIVPVLNS